jgi:hypothetical protein
MPGGFGPLKFLRLEDALLGGFCYTIALLDPESVKMSCGALLSLFVYRFKGSSYDCLLLPFSL